MTKIKEKIMDFYEHQTILTTFNKINLEPLPETSSSNIYILMTNSTNKSERKKISAHSFGYFDLLKPSNL